MAMTANAGRQPGANEVARIGRLPGAEGKAVTHFIQSRGEVGLFAGTRREIGCRRCRQLRHEHTSVRRPKRTACCVLSTDPPDDHRAEAGRHG
jgi:hypothetical protein